MCTGGETGIVSGTPLLGEEKFIGAGGPMCDVGVRNVDETRLDEYKLVVWIGGRSKDCFGGYASPSEADCVAIAGAEAEIVLGRCFGEYRWVPWGEGTYAVGTLDGKYVWTDGT